MRAEEGPAESTGWALVRRRGSGQGVHGEGRAPPPKPTAPRQLVDAGARGHSVGGGEVTRGLSTPARAQPQTNAVRRRGSAAMPCNMGLGCPRVRGQSVQCRLISTPSRCRRALLSPISSASSSRRRRGQTMLLLSGRAACCSRG
jgi:hypothetical protein